MFFLFSTSLRPWAACWFTHTGSQAHRPQETLPSTTLDFPLFPHLCRPLTATLGFSRFTQLALTKALPLFSFLISNKTLFCCSCYSHMILWHTEGLVLCAKTWIHTSISNRQRLKLSLVYISESILPQGSSFSSICFHLHTPKGTWLILHTTLFQKITKRWSLLPFFFP